MPATTDTTEQIPAGIKEGEMDNLVTLRLQAGAITSTYTGSKSAGWTLTTTWNVIDQQ